MISTVSLYFLLLFFLSFTALHDLQGVVETFFLSVESPQSSQKMAYRPEITSAVIRDLWPTTTYRVSLQVFNGAHNTTKTTINVTTADGGKGLLDCMFYLIKV